MSPLPRRGLALLLALLPARVHAAAAGDLPSAAEAVPPRPLRPAWEAAGRPLVVILPDHLGLDARAGFHAEALLARGLSVLPVALPAATEVGLSDRLRPGPPVADGAAAALLPGLLALRRRLAAGPGRPIGVLGFGTGGEAALLAARAPAGRGFAAHAALYPTCGGPPWPIGAVPAGPILLIQPHPGGAGDLPEGCGLVPDPPAAPAADQVTLLGYDSLGHGFDLWPAIAWQKQDAGFDPLRFDALRAALARRDIAGFFAAVLAPARGPAADPSNDPPGDRSIARR
jgi:dienelactone hydrolase